MVMQKFEMVIRNVSILLSKIFGIQKNKLDINYKYEKNIDI